MKNERILSVGMYGINHDVIKRVIMRNPEDGHEMVGEANSYGAIASLSQQDDSEKPTVAVIVDYADPEDNKRTVTELNRYYPGIKIIGLGVGSDAPVNKRLEMPYTERQIREALLEV
jgi:hypothetical protein